MPPQPLLPSSSSCHWAQTLITPQRTRRDSTVTLRTPPATCEPPSRPAITSLAAPPPPADSSDWGRAGSIRRRGEATHGPRCPPRPLMRARGGLRCLICELNGQRARGGVKCGHGGGSSKGERLNFQCLLHPSEALATSFARAVCAKLIAKRLASRKHVFGIFFQRI